jgi:hypothetical protein
MAFKKAGLPRSLQLNKKDRTAAYHAKEAFMKEAMARHLAAAELNAATTDPTHPNFCSAPTAAAPHLAAAIPHEFGSSAAEAAAAAHVAAAAANNVVVDAAGNTVLLDARRPDQRGFVDAPYMTQDETTRKKEPSAVTYAKRTSAEDIENKRLAKKEHVAKLKSRMGMAPGNFLPGQLKYEVGLYNPVL